MIWSKQIDSFLIRGVFLGPLGTNNWAMSRDDAMSAVKQLEALGVPVLGGDVYQLLNGVIEPTYDSWYCDQQLGELDSTFLERSVNVTTSYICKCSTSETLFALVPGAK